MDIPRLKGTERMNLAAGFVGCRISNSLQNSQELGPIVAPAKTASLPGPARPGFPRPRRP
ncbi:MAG: hypothetical protein ACRDNT_30195 [Streptosporangiaceae bacterium]